MTPRDWSDHELLANVRTLLGSHREITANLVLCLAEIEERRLHLLAGFPSMFEYCTRHLGMSEGEAFRRILAARLGRRFPAAYGLLASGAVHLSALELLREHLTEENHEELLGAASHKNKREIEMMLAARFPRPDAPSRIRAARVEPLSLERFRIELTVTREVVDKLELCRDLLRHSNPSGDIAVIIERALDLLVADLQAKRLAHAKRPGADRTGVHEISRATRRQVFRRDGLRCTYVSPDGHRCDARAFLELDHIDPRAVGGAHDADNLRVLCRSHNQLHAEQTFGRRHVQHRRHLRQQKCSPNAETWNIVLRALKRLGFRDGQARTAIRAAERIAGDVPHVESALRAALRAAAEPPT